jgi:Sulfotransferase domain
MMVATADRLQPHGAEPSPLARLRHALWETKFRIRVRLGRGALPNALIIGASKGGTTSIYHWLSRHPAVCVSRVKEVRFFNGHYERGAGWYAAQFAPKPGRTVLIEASPSYLWDPDVPDRVRSLLGEPKLIVLLREPVERAWSQYWMKVRRGEETASFDQVVEREAESFGLAGQMPLDGSVPRLRYGRESYLGKGLYAPQIERWLSVFPRECFHFIRSEDLFRAPAETMSGLLRFLDLPPMKLDGLEPFNAGRYPPLDPDVRGRLAGCFAQSNARVKRLTGISWP